MASEIYGTICYWQHVHLTEESFGFPLSVFSLE